MHYGQEKICGFFKGSNLHIYSPIAPGFRMSEGKSLKS